MQGQDDRRHRRVRRVGERRRGGGRRSRRLGRGPRRRPVRASGARRRLGPKALLIGGVDLSSPEGAQKAMGAVKANFGRLDALLNIAGGFQWEHGRGRHGRELGPHVRAQPEDGAERMQSRASLSSRERRRPHRQCRRAIRPPRGGGNGPLRRQQVGGAPADREPWPTS